jgi:aryl-alcohol dehydrogenase-like predicted oxidoreductase
MPRFEPVNYAANLSLRPAYVALAREAGCSPAQLALAWLLHQAPHIVPIPGTTSLDHLADDLGASRITLKLDLLARLDGLINQQTVHGARYGAQASGEVDTESF